jgi:hypothetical protein
MGEIFGIITSAVDWIVSIFKFCRNLVDRSRPVLFYQFDENHVGGSYRGMHHSFGEAVDDSDASNKKAWAHTVNSLNDGQATCYGPYTKGIPFKGKYKATFRVKTSGIPKTNDLVAVVDVAYSSIDPSGNPLSSGIVLKETPIYGNNFQNGKYQNFDVSFDYDNQPFIEFRCLVENPENFGQNGEKIFFDNVKIFPVK